MAKSKSMFDGKNAVQQSAHITSRVVANNDPMKSRKVYPDGANPFNDFVKDDAGVLGPNVKGQNSGQYADSPVPAGAQKPDISITSKAGEVGGNTNGLPGGGILNR